MIRLIILFALGAAVGFFVIKFLNKKRDVDVIDGEVIEENEKSESPRLYTILLLGIVVLGTIFFILPRLGISVTGFIQKVLAFLPVIRGFLPF